MLPALPSTPQPCLPRAQLPAGGFFSFRARSVPRSHVGRQMGKLRPGGELRRLLPPSLGLRGPGGHPASSVISEDGALARGGEGTRSRSPRVAGLPLVPRPTWPLHARWGSPPSPTGPPSLLREPSELTANTQSESAVWECPPEESQAPSYRRALSPLPAAR